MSYQALYRAWRPEKFEDVCGQQAITRTLTAQIMSGRIAHAYLFCGSRGTGKTTTAKVLARAVNCENARGGEPCGECYACKELKGDNNLDILEIDAASNNGVDEVRELRERIAYPPTVGRYKVYIIDEVHMLSASAFNALLKTLEEPPAHAIFILATTEPQKLPATVLSRCQRFDFKRIPVSVIIERMRVVLGGIGREADDDALDEIARASEGGMRDALSLLDMCLSYAAERVSAQLVRDVLGTAGREFMFRFAEALIKGEAGKALIMIDDAMRDGRDAQVFAREVATHMRTLLIALMVGDALPDLAEITREDADAFRAQAQSASEEKLMRVMELFVRAEGDMKWVSRPRSVLELCAARACAPEHESGAEALMERVKALEDKLKHASALISAPEQAATQAPAEPKPARPPRPRAAAPEYKAPAAAASNIEQSEDAKLFEKGVAAYAEKTPSVRSFLAHMKYGGRDGDVIHARFGKNSNIQMQLLHGKTADIEACLSEAFGEKLRLSMAMDGAAPPARPKTESGDTLIMSFDVFGRDKVEIVD